MDRSAGWGGAAALAMSAVGLAGCATLSRGLDDEVAVVSEPAGAAVSSSVGATCPATPCTLRVGRAATFSVTVSKAGFAPQTVPVSTRVSSIGAALASENVATAGLGLALDAATGGTLEHAPNPVDVTLAALGAPAPR